MKITINGQINEVTVPFYLDQALTEFDTGSGRFAVALNGQFIAKTQYADTQLHANDVIDIMSPIAGG
jgi:sulfur carrier protein